MSKDHNINKERFTCNVVSEGSVHGSGSKAETSWKKALVEENCSSHDGQEEEHRDKHQ